ncbi:UNVERIFIED_CONTAM: hypothetical protein FKN15_061596 [Acipenser sinensis]
MNTRCPPKRVPSATRVFTLCRLTVQRRRTTQLWAAYREARRRPARLQGSLVRGSAHPHYRYPCADSGGAKMNTRCPPKRVPSATRVFTLCRLTVQRRRTTQLWAAYREARRRPARLQGSLVRGEPRTPWPT